MNSSNKEVCCVGEIRYDIDSNKEVCCVGEIRYVVDSNNFDSVARIAILQ